MRIVRLRHSSSMRAACCCQSSRQDVAAAGGMYAGGDWMLEILIGCMLLVPTFVLVLVIRKSERLYAGYPRSCLA